MSSFTEAGFEPVMMPNGKQKEREGRKVFRIRGRDGDGFRFHIGYVGSGLVVHVPEGFETDELSIPGFKSKGLLKVLGLVTWLIPKYVRELGQLPAAVHDFLCEHPRFTRDDADAQFWAAMAAMKIPFFWRKRLFNAVVLNESKERHNDEDLFGDQPSLFGGRS